MERAGCAASLAFSCRCGCCPACSGGCSWRRSPTPTRQAGSRSLARSLVNHGTARCISFGGLRADNAVGTEGLRVLKPLGLDAAVKALAAQRGEISAAERQLDLALKEAHLVAAHARRQYDAVDPANRLVAGEQERRWNEALQVVHRLQGEIAELEAKKPAPLGEKERQHL